MRGPSNNNAGAPPDAGPPPVAILPTLLHEPAAGERRSLLGEGLGPTSSSSATMTGFDGVERGGSGGNQPSTSSPVVLATAVSPPIARKLDRAILPALCTLTLVNYLDRSNLAFAALPMRADTGITEAQYGYGASLFFLGYCLPQVPLVWLAVRFTPGGPPRALAACCVAWGCAAAGMALVQGPASFYVSRIAVGIAEAATFPLMWALLSAFYAPGEIAHAYGALLACVSVAQIAGGPLAAILLAADGVGGLAGWRWLFLVEAAPTLLLALWVSRLPASPPAASSLTPDERAWLVARQAAGATAAVKANGGRGTGAAAPPPPLPPLSPAARTSRWARWAALAASDAAGAATWRTWALGAMEIAVSACKYATLYWTPLLVDAILGGGSKKDGLHPHPPPSPRRAAAAAALSAIPFGAVAASTLLNGRHSKLTGERRWHVVWPIAVSVVGLAGLALTLPASAGDPLTPARSALAFLALLLAAQVFACAGVVSSYPASFLSGPAAAVGYAVTNGLGNAGGLIGPALFGAARAATGSYRPAAAALAGIGAVGAAAYGTLLPRIAPDTGVPVVVAGGEGGGP